MPGEGKRSRRAGNLFFCLVEKTGNAGQVTPSGRKDRFPVRADKRSLFFSPRKSVDEPDTGLVPCLLLLRFRLPEHAAAWEYGGNEGPYQRRVRGRERPGRAGFAAFRGALRHHPCPERRFSLLSTGQLMEPGMGGRYGKRRENGPSCRAGVSTARQWGLRPGQKANSGDRPWYRGAAESAAGSGENPHCGPPGQHGGFRRQEEKTMENAS